MAPNVGRVKVKVMANVKVFQFIDVNKCRWNESQVTTRTSGLE